VTTLTLYAIADVRPRGALGKGLGGKPLSVVRAAGAHVVIERAPPAQVSARALRGHDRIVRRVTRAAPAVLPVRFGTSVSDARALSALLEPLSSALSSALDTVRGCVQYTLRIRGRAAAPPSPDPHAGPGARFMAQRMASRRAPEIDPVTKATKPWVRASRIERADRKDLLATVYHLVSRADSRTYRAALSKSLLSIRSVTVTTTGPWPAYAFADLP
jgi:hypothetical protein